MATGVPATGSGPITPSSVRAEAGETLVSPPSRITQSSHLGAQCRLDDTPTGLTFSFHLPPHGLA